MQTPGTISLLSDSNAAEMIGNPPTQDVATRNQGKIRAIACGGLLLIFAIVAAAAIMPVGVDLPSTFLGIP